MSNPHSGETKMPGSGNSLPTSLYASLLGKLVTILELDPGTTATVQGRQALLQATNDFKSSLAHAKELAVNLPGGELKTSEQDDIINMLEGLKDRRRDQLAHFKSATKLDHVEEDIKMADMDSTASTPTN
ncbi:hypothetical protein BDZ89DRAFT_1058840 [Hymenopellis radicata]|nr:hypothetical protein BDZ89DRAFT_1058840 [Hymenopellis radicata]